MYGVMNITNVAAHSMDLPFRYRKSNGNMRTLLNTAAQSGCIRIAELLIKRGADVNPKLPDGQEGAQHDSPQPDTVSMPLPFSLINFLIFD